MYRLTFGQAAFSLALFFALACPAHAGSFVVNPIRVTLTANRPLSAITVRNTGTEAAVIQLEANRWSQRDGEDLLEKSNELLATPPIFTIPPGGAQIIRLGLRSAPDVRQEQTFRLILQEIPPPQSIAQGLRVALKVSLPVFVMPASAAAPQLEWRAIRQADGNIRLQASNSGTAHVQISKVSLSTADSSKAIVAQEISQYVLPANTRHWVMPAGGLPAGTSLQLQAQTDAGEMRASVPLESDGSPSVARVNGPSAH